MDESVFPLAEGFPVADRAAWLALVERSLKGASYEATLVSHTADGIRIEPLYTGTDADPGFPGLPPFLRGADAAGRVAAGWDVRQLHDHPDPAAANRAILEDLDRGVTSIALRLDTAFALGEEEPDGVLVYDVAGLDRALEGVLLDLAPVQLVAPGRDVPAAEAFLELVAQRGHDPATFVADLGLDPIAAVALGRAEPERALLPALGLARRVAGDWPQLNLLRVDAEPYHAAGASEAQELAAAVATGIQYLREGEKLGLEPAELAPRLRFTLAADADIFLTIAKCRAARRLWAGVMAACGAPAVPMRLDARSASRMLTRRDPHVNMLRTTAACFAGVIGGAEAVTITPFDAATGEAGRLGRRIARNVQLVLMEESNFHRVIDPAGGSAYVETLSSGLAARAWPMVQAIEGEGGMLASLRQGIVQDAIGGVYLARLDDLAHRRSAITGVSSFPDLAEAPQPQEPLELDPLLAAAARILGDRRPPERPVAVLRPMRLAEGFERLRDLSDLALGDSGSRPAVFIAALGPLARHAGDAAFVEAALAAGGIASVTSPPLESAADAVDAFAASGLKIACICGVDRNEPASAEPVATALLAAGAVALYAAGRPDPALRAMGVDGFVHAGANILGLAEDIQSLVMGEAV